MKQKRDSIILLYAFVILIIAGFLYSNLFYKDITGSAVRTKNLLEETPELEFEEKSIPGPTPPSPSSLNIVAPNIFNLSGSLAPVGAGISGFNYVRFDPYSNLYLFIYSPDGSRVNAMFYTINISDQEIRKGILWIKAIIPDYNLEFYPLAGGNTYYRNLSGDFVWDVPWTANIIFQHTLWPNNIVSLYYNETYQGKSTEKQYDIKISGKTLLIRIHKVDNDLSPFGNYAGILVDRAQFPSISLWNPKSFNISYMESVPITVAGTGNNKLFYSVMVDWIKSNLNNWPWHSRGISPYFANSFSNGFIMAYTYGLNNVFNRMDETLYLTVSKNVEDLFINYYNRTPSPYLQDLKRRAILDTSVFASKQNLPGNTTFNKHKYLLDVANAYGLEKVLYIMYGWSDYNINITCGSLSPMHFPALQYSWAGGNAGMSNLINTSKIYNYLVAPYHQYVDMYINSPSWNASHLSKNETGGYMYVWNDPNCNQHYQIASDKTIYHAQQDTPLIENTFNLDAVYVDVSPKSYFKPLIDFNPVNPNSRSIRDGFQHIVNLHKFIRNAYQGPVVGEGGQDAMQTDRLQAGYTDGVESEITGREDVPIIPNFELKYVNKLMMNQGMGIESRWLSAPDPSNEIPIDLDTFDRDKYIATLLAFGHATWFSTFYLLLVQQSQWPSITKVFNHMVKSYYRTYAVQKDYSYSTVQEIKYLNTTGNLVDLNQALKENIDFYNVRLFIKYFNGLELYINRHQSQTWTLDLSGVNYYIPKNGWIAINTNSNFFAGSLLVNANGIPTFTGHRADMVVSNDYIMVDPRGTYTNFIFTDYNNLPVNASHLKVWKPTGWWLYELPNETLVSATPPPNPSTPGGTSPTPPYVQLTQPANYAIFNVQSVLLYSFGTSVTDLTTATLYRMITSSLGNTQWSSSASQTVSGTSALVSFNLSNLPLPSVVQWNVKFCNQAGLCAFAPENRTVYIGTPIDNIPPIVTITSPLNNAVVLGATATIVSVNAQDNLAISNVSGYKAPQGSSNFVFFGVDTAYPYQLSWAHGGETTGLYQLRAVAYDLSNNQGNHTIMVNVNMPPAVTITNPPNGAAVSGQITVTATASEPIAQMQFYHNGQLRCTDTSSPYSCNMNTNPWPSGANTITAIGTENIPGVGSQAGSASITVYA